MSNHKSDTPRKISLYDLQQMLNDIDVPESEIRPYLKINEETSGAYDPQIEVNRRLVEDEEGLEGAVLVGALNGISRSRRKRKYDRKTAKGFQGIKIVSEGDSWFQYPFILDDVIDHLNDQPDIAIRSLGAAGDLLAKMVAKNEYTEAIQQEEPAVFLVSGGGNDLVGDERLTIMLHPFDENREAKDYPNAAFEQFENEIQGSYQTLFENLAHDFPSLRVMCHGYDFVIPNKGKWLGKPMEKINIDDQVLQRDIIESIMDRFNERIKTTTQGFANVTYINGRNTVTEWHDELHPKSHDFKKVAKLFEDAIRNP